MSRASTRVIGLMAILLSAVALGSCGKDDEPDRVPSPRIVGGPTERQTRGSPSPQCQPSTTPDPPSSPTPGTLGTGPRGQAPWSRIPIPTRRRGSTTNLRPWTLTNHRSGRPHGVVPGGVQDHGPVLRPLLPLLPLLRLRLELALHPFDRRLHLPRIDPHTVETSPEIRRPGHATPVPGNSSGRGGPPASSRGYRVGQPEPYMLPHARASRGSATARSSCDRRGSWTPRSRPTALASAGHRFLAVPRSVPAGCRRSAP